MPDEDSNSRRQEYQYKADKQGGVRHCAGEDEHTRLFRLVYAGSTFNGRSVSFNNRLSAQRYQ
jgi:hypothetical protein